MMVFLIKRIFENAQETTILQFSFDSVNLIISFLIWHSLYIDVQTIL